MRDETEADGAFGGNTQQVLRSYGRRLSNILNEIADLQDDAKQVRAEAKADGYEVKVLNKVIQELRRGEDYRQGQLELELMLNTYRAAMDLPTTLEDAQTQAREAAEVVPDVRSRRQKGAKGEEA